MPAQPSDNRVWFTAQDSGELGLRSEGEKPRRSSSRARLVQSGTRRTRIPRNRHTRPRVDPDETTKADLVEREGRRPWRLAHDKAELAKAITRAQ